MRVCLIGAMHPSHNPRLLREADTLAEAGHEVRVVSPSYMPELALKDQRQFAHRNWRLQQVDYRPVGWRGKTRSFAIRGRRKLAQSAFEKSGGLKLAQYAYTAAFPELMALAVGEPADWFIAHAHAALPVAAKAAKRWNARLGFDCEDLLSVSGTDPVDIVKLIEEKYLPECDYVTVPSHAMANQLVQWYEIQTPIVLYNVFPLSLAEGMLSPLERTASEGKPLRLHWFSQTIGPGRGLEEVIEALSLLGGDSELHLRGMPARGYEEVLYSLARHHGLMLKLHPLVDHDDLIKTMDAFDVGLALERPENGNYSLTVTNKIGSYLLAGLAVVATDTPGQREVLNRVPGAGVLYRAGSPHELADALRPWLNDRQALLNVQQAAWNAARKRFCWDIEREAFLQLLEQKKSARVERIA
jgi:glycosyltransferase involved in cell wall biosynthesis